MRAGPLRWAPVPLHTPSASFTQVSPRAEGGTPPSRQRQTLVDNLFTTALPCSVPVRRGGPRGEQENPTCHPCRGVRGTPREGEPGFVGWEMGALLQPNLGARGSEPPFLGDCLRGSTSRRAAHAAHHHPHALLPPQLKKPEWAPDFGPPTFVPRWGATVTGARTFLIAYNINLLCTKELAHRIALNIREQGRGSSQVPSCCPLTPLLLGWAATLTTGVLRSLDA